MKKYLLVLSVLFLFQSSVGQNRNQTNEFAVKGFHLDLRIQVMTIPALKDFALKLSKSGINTLVMEYEATYPFEKHLLIPNRYAYTKDEIKGFVSYCSSVGIDVIPLQQAFGHVEYILRNARYTLLREDQRDFSQVCPSKPELDKALFTDLFTELAATHPSKYFHIGGDETRLLGHCPLCKKKAEAEGISKLYIDHIRMLCDIVIKLGKRPILWADIALKYPEAIKLLPKETILIDWNYGWEMNRFGDHKKLMDSGFEIWGSPSLRSNPDNYYLTQWEKHFNNIRDFVPASRELGYKGMVMTSWSTSGIYSTLYDAESSVTDLYAIRRVYPITGFNLLLQGFIKGIGSPQPLDVRSFVQQYCRDTYGFNTDQSNRFWNALKASPNTVREGVVSPSSISLQQLLDSASLSEKVINELKPVKNIQEYEHYKLMAGTRVQYLAYQNILKQTNSETFTPDKVAPAVAKLKGILAATDAINKRFIELNKGYYHPSELAEENRTRKMNMQILYDRLAKMR